MTLCQWREMKREATTSTIIQHRQPPPTRGLPYLVQLAALVMVGITAMPSLFPNRSIAHQLSTVPVVSNDVTTAKTISTIHDSQHFHFHDE